MRNYLTFRKLLAVLAVIFLLPVSVYAGEPPKDPILSIETGMHTARITEISVDAENRLLATASDDKTVRLWNAADEPLLKAYRIPIGPGNEGKLYAVAISPDGKTIACGGYTGWDWEQASSIYLFDRESGNLVKRLDGIPSGIVHIAFSRDGRFLVACLARYPFGQKFGIQIYKMNTILSRMSTKPLMEDYDYSDQSYGADFDGRGRLVTTCYDGYVRLYDQDFRLIAKKKAPGKWPSTVSFSPDGQRIAVGFDKAPHNSKHVSVLSGSNLEHLYSPDAAGVDKGLVGRVSWSADGGFLYAGGEHIHRWAEVGRGSRLDIQVGANMITGIKPRKDGGVFFAASGPVLGALDKDGRQVFLATPSIANYKRMLKGFLVSQDGATIQFGYEEGGKSPARYSVNSRNLDIMPASSTDLRPPRTQASGLEITDWEYTLYPTKLNGKPLPLLQNEVSFSLAIAPDGNSFLHGSLWNLRCFDRNGQEKWKVAAPGVTLAVNVSGSGQVAVAAYGDGTIRWYRMDNGKELLSFFPNSDRKRWVLWTNSGYYDASPGAEELIGWHLNNGRDAVADFFPVSKFRSVYYRPDMMARILETLDEKEALHLVNQESGRKQQEVSIQNMLPPVVSIISPRENGQVDTAEVTVAFSVRSPSSEPVTSIKALVDGRPVANQRGVVIKPKGDDIREIVVPIPEKDSDISIIAENKFASSTPATVRVKWRGTKAREDKGEFVIKPKLYILAIGVSKYNDKDLTLNFAAKDATDFSRAMKGQKGKLYREVSVKVLTDDAATKDEILDGLDWITKETTSKDVAIIFLAGHGVNDATGIYYYLPANANIDKLKRTALAFSDIKNTIASLAGKALLFVDTCHAGNIMGKRRGTTDITGLVNELASAESGAVVFASSTGRQYSQEDAAWGNGAFTKALVEGMLGKADYMGKGKITVNMLDLYISERVKELTKGKQTPTTSKPETIQDFPIAFIER